MLLLVVLIWQPVWQQGLFMDGLIYSTIANNWHLGMGSWEEPHFSTFIYPTFPEHPPLMPFMLKLLFDVLGNSFWVEKLFSFLSVIPTVLGITLLAKHFKLSWSTIGLALFFYITTSSISWGLQSNMLENWLSPFCLFSVLFFLKFTQTNKWQTLVLSSLFLILACLTKGPVALFPLAVFAAQTLSVRFVSFGKSLKQGLLFVGVFIFLFSTLLLIPSVRNNLINYWNAQVVSALSGAREVTGHWVVPMALLKEQILAIAFALISAITAFAKKRKPIFSSHSIFYLLMGLLASLPLIISPKQHSFYIIPSIPFYALAFATFVIENFSWGTPQWLNKVAIGFSIVSGSLLFLPIFVSKPYFRDSSLFKDLTSIQEKLPNETVYFVKREGVLPWSVIGYLKRFNNMDCTLEASQATYGIVYAKHPVPEGWSTLDLPLNELRVIEKLPK